jgi:hypothetical protein
MKFLNRLRLSTPAVTFLAAAVVAVCSVPFSVGSALAGEVGCGIEPSSLGGDPYPLPCFKPIVAQRSCVEQNEDGTFTVGWGYNNTNNACCPQQILPIRTDSTLNGNNFSPSPIDRGQPVQTIDGQTGVVFTPGSTSNLFSTTWDGSPLTWNIRSYVITSAGFSVFSSAATASGTASEGLCPNAPPVCALAQPQVGVVTSGAGRVAEIRLNASNSSDPENRPLRFSWNIECNDGPGAVEITGSNTATPVIRLAGPAQGRSVSCTAALEIRDVRNVTSCQQSAAVQPLDCAGQVGGSAAVDQCGICGGNNSCLDCAGVPFGTSVVDRCGVCAGNGQSCVNCASVNQINNLLAVDGNAEAQRRVVGRAAKRLAATARASASDRKAAKNADSRAQALYLTNWRVTWTFPQVSVSCIESPFCTTKDNQTLIATYSGNAVELRNLARSLAIRIAKFDRNYANRTRRDAERQFKAANQGISLIPAQQSQCSL